MDSTFGGGGAGHKGHQMIISYPLSKKVILDLHLWLKKANKSMRILPLKAYNNV